MNNENNFLVGLLVVAIVVAVAGTWLNLQTTQSKVSVTGMSSGTGLIENSGASFNTIDNGDPADVTDLSGDCSFASYQTAATINGEANWCTGGNWTTEMSNFTVTAWNNFNKYYVDVNTSHDFLESEYVLGYAIVSGDQTGITKLSAWGAPAGNCEITPAEGWDNCIIASNITGITNRTITFAHGGNMFWNETQGVYTVTFVASTVDCGLVACPAADS